jgi:hypothetical protein
MKSLSHPFRPPLLSHIRKPESRKDLRKKVHFAFSTADITNTLFERRNFRFSHNSTGSLRHCRPILKYSEDMAGYLRSVGGTFARALSALGVWCTGVTSDNPNIRSDMYKQLVAQVRGISPHLRQAGESVLQANIHGMWVQLVDDFSINREEYTPSDMILYSFCRVRVDRLGMRMQPKSLGSFFQIIDFWKNLTFWMYKVLFWRL